MAKLILTVKGKVGAISLDSFLSVINNSLGILKDLDSAISLQPRGSLDWIVTDFHMGSFGVEVESKPRDPSKDYGKAVTERYLDGIDAIHREGITPPYFSDNSLKLLRKTAKVFGGNGVEALEIIDPVRNKSTQYDKRIEAITRQLMGSKYQSFGSIEGTLEMISIHRIPRFNVYHAISLRAVQCTLPDELKDEVVGALGRRVIAAGLISYNVKDEPRSVKLEDLRVIPKENELPTIEEFIGSVPDFTGEMTTAEYIRSIRSA